MMLEVFDLFTHVIDQISACAFRFSNIPVVGEQKRDACCLVGYGKRPQESRLEENLQVKAASVWATHMNSDKF